VYGHPISENAIEKTGIEHYYYIAKFNYGDAINTTCNLLTLTSPLMLHLPPAAGRSRQEEVEQEDMKPIRTCRSPPWFSTLDQASDESKSMHEEQFRATHGDNPCMITRVLRLQLRRLASNTTTTSPSSKTKMPPTPLATAAPDRSSDVTYTTSGGNIMAARG
jgi:hypothetical protein